MISGIENMSTEQLREIIRIQAIQARESEDQITWYKKAIEVFEKKTQILEE